MVTNTQLHAFMRITRLKSEKDKNNTSGKGGTACKIQNGCHGGPNWPMGSGKKSNPIGYWTLQSTFAKKVFAGAARRAGPDSMLILCQCEIISRPLIGRKLAT